MRALPLFGILLPLLCGGVVAAGLGAGVLGGDEGSVPLTVPSGQIGDEADYRVRWVQGRAPNGTLSNESGEYAHGYHVVGHTKALDRAGVAHDVLEVESTTHAAPALGSTRLIGQGVQRGIAHVDLETRDTIQRRVHLEPLELARSEGALVSSLFEFGIDWTEFGPYLEDVYSYHYWIRWGAFGRGTRLPFEFQGRTLAVGQDLRDEDLASGLLDNIQGQHVWGRFIGVTLHSFNYTSGVVAQGILSSDPVVAVQRDLTLLYGRVDASRTAGPQEREWRDTISTRAWMSETLPYPLRIEHIYHRELLAGKPHPINDAVVDLSFTLDLVRYKAGNGPISWGECGVIAHYDDVNHDVERATRGETYPPSGGVNVSYLLEDALNQVTRDPTLTKFASWRRAHPDARLVGFDYSPYAPPAYDASGASTSNLATWDLVYASSGAARQADQAFVVSSGRNGTTGLVVNREWGAAPLPASIRFYDSKLPPNPITLGTVERLWRALAPPSTTSAMEPLISWGLSSNAWSQPGGPIQEPLRVVGLEGSWQSAEFGGYVPRPDARFSPPSVRQRYDGSEFEMNVQSGLLGPLYAWRDIDAYEPSLPLLRDKQEIRAAAVPPSGGEAPSGLLVGGLVSSGLLAVFLVAYFYPLLKLGATNLLIVLPGYAKLRKDELLDNSFREDLVQLVRQEPGISPPEMHRRVGGGWTTVVYHLRVLEQNGLVSSLLDGRHRRFFPKGTKDWSRRDEIAVLRNATSLAIFSRISEHPGITQSDLARQAGISPSGAQWHLKRLGTAGLVRVEPQGRLRRYFASGRAEEFPEVA